MFMNINSNSWKFAHTSHGKEAQERIEINDSHLV